MTDQQGVHITKGARRAAIWLLILTLVVGAGNLWASYDLTRGVQREKTAQMALCQAGNVARAQQVGLWTYILDLPPAKGSPPPTAEQKKRVAEFRVYLGKVFAPRDCSHLGR